MARSAPDPARPRAAPSSRRLRLGPASPSPRRLPPASPPRAARRRQARRRFSDLPRGRRPAQPLASPAPPRSSSRMGSGPAGSAYRPPALRTEIIAVGSEVGRATGEAALLPGVDDDRGVLMVKDRAGAGDDPLSPGRLFFAAAPGSLLATARRKHQVRNG